MKDFIEVSIGFIAAFLLYVGLRKISISLFEFFNVLSLVVIYFALAKGEIFGACLGAFCGLVQDSFSLGVFGVAGLAKTVVGFLAGSISKKIDVIPFVRNFVFLFVLLGFEFIFWIFLYSFVFSESINLRGGLSFFQTLITAIFGSLVFLILRKYKSVSL